MEVEVLAEATKDQWGGGLPAGDQRGGDAETNSESVMIWYPRSEPLVLLAVKNNDLEKIQLQPKLLRCFSLDGEKDFKINRS
uniref:Uncharacterized protein n=1 Tax=Leersia perrieri TaxID=77586 RepID=A0A0D9XVJ1_9ORYZ